tara:strand:+ start:1658 stop:2248 length:591 start_codon:yes stop_codon:yes gene_type:complete
LKKDDDNIFHALNIHLEYQKEFKNCVDIGYCNGSHSRIYIKAFEKVVAFDCHPYVELIEDEKFIYYNQALHSTDSYKEFYIDTIHKGLSTFYKENFSRWKEKGYKSNIIKTIRSTKKLDSYKLEPDFIKIDAEGSEYDIILGGIETIKKYKPTLQVEIIKLDNEIKRKNLKELLFPIGYELIEKDKKLDPIFIYKE